MLLGRLQLLGLAGGEDFHDARAPIQMTLLPPSVLPERYLPLPAEPAPAKLKLCMLLHVIILLYYMIKCLPS